MLFLFFRNFTYNICLGFEFFSIPVIIYIKSYIKFLVLWANIVLLEHKQKKMERFWVKETKGARMTGVSRGVECPLLHETLHTVLKISPAQTPSVWLLVRVLIIAKDRGVHGEHLAPENQLIPDR